VLVLLWCVDGLRSVQEAGDGGQTQDPSAQCSRLACKRRPPLATCRRTARMISSAVVDFSLGGPVKLWALRETPWNVNTSKISKQRKGEASERASSGVGGSILALFLGAALHQHLLGRPACKLDFAHGHPCQKAQHCPSSTGAQQEPTTSTAVRSLQSVPQHAPNQKARFAHFFISSFSCSLIGLLCHEVFASQSALGKEEVISESALRSLSSFAAPGIVCCGDWQCLFLSS
jgi:hypothetical protein